TEFTEGLIDHDSSDHAAGEPAVRAVRGQEPRNRGAPRFLCTKECGKHGCQSHGGRRRGCPFHPGGPAWALTATGGRPCSAWCCLRTTQQPPSALPPKACSTALLPRSSSSSSTTAAPTAPALPSSTSWRTTACG